MSCNKLYSQYKKDCSGIDVFETKLEYMKSNSISDISIQIDQIMKEYSRTRKCMNGRLDYTNKCIHESKQDEGHNIQIKLLEKKLSKYEKILSLYYKQINRILRQKEISSPIKTDLLESSNLIIKDADKSNIVSGHKNLSNNHLISNDTLLNMGYSIAYIIDDNKIKKDLVNGHKRLLSLLKKRDINEISLRAIDNKYIYSFIVPYAIENKDNELLVKLIPNLTYLISNNKDSKYASEILDLIEKYFVSIDSPNLFHIFNLRSDIEISINSENNITMGSIDIFSLARNDKTNILSLVLVSSNHILENLNQESIYDIIHTLDFYFKKSQKVEQRYMQILSILYKYIDYLYIIDKWLETPLSQVRSIIIILLSKDLALRTNVDDKDRIDKLATKVNDVLKRYPTCSSYCNTLSGILLGLHTVITLTKKPYINLVIK